MGCKEGQREEVQTEFLDAWSAKSCSCLFSLSSRALSCSSLCSPVSHPLPLALCILESWSLGLSRLRAAAVSAVADVLCYRRPTSTGYLILGHVIQARLEVIHLTLPFLAILFESGSREAGEAGSGSKNSEKRG